MSTLRPPTASLSVISPAVDERDVLERLGLRSPFDEIREHDATRPVRMTLLHVKQPVVVLDERKTAMEHGVHDGKYRHVETDSDGESHDSCYREARVAA